MKLKQKKTTRARRGAGKKIGGRAMKASRSTTRPGTARTSGSRRTRHARGTKVAKNAKAS